MKQIQFTSRTTEMADDLLYLVNLNEEPPLSYIPDISPGDMVKVYNHDEIVEMTVFQVNNAGRELTLHDECGFRHLASLWRWTDMTGDIFITKTSMKHKSAGAWNPWCCKKCSLKTLKKAA